MARSERSVVVALLAGATVACNALAGLGSFQEVECAGACADAGRDAPPAKAQSTSPSPNDAGLADGDATSTVDAQPANDAGGGDGSGDDASGDDYDAAWLDGFVPFDAAPTYDYRWAHWVVPNGEDAAVNPSRYTSVIPDGVQDDVTGLVWSNRLAVGVTTLDAARAACLFPWRLPTRMQLLSLYDPNGLYGLPAAFGGFQGAVWSASTAPDGSPWGVSFQGPTVATNLSPQTVICVQVLP
jgi:hypothetical protein